MGGKGSRGRGQRLGRPVGKLAGLRSGGHYLQMARAGAKRRQTPLRQPTYPAAKRIARLVHGLAEHPHGWSFEAICSEFAISEKTLRRYVKLCEETLVDGRGRPLVEVVEHGNRKLLRFQEKRASTEAGSYEMASLLFLQRLARFLEGTVLEQGSEGVWRRLLEKIPSDQRRRLENVDRKFVAVDYLPKDYRGRDEQLDQILRALMDQYRVTITYARVGAEERQHEFEPYTLAGYRGGLYVLGRIRRYRNVIWLAVDRMRSVVPTTDADGKRIPFAYPTSFQPTRYTNGVFGLVEGDEIDVEIAIENQETEAYLHERRVHPSQRFSEGKDGRTRLHLRVRGTTELSNWLLRMMPYVEVVAPEDLRDEVRQRLEHGLRLHRKARARSATRREAVGVRS